MKHKVMLGAVLLVGAAALLVPAAGGAKGSPASPPSLSWNPTNAGFFGTSDSHDFILTNSGGSATGTITVSLPNSDSNFFLAADHCTGKSLGPGKSCTVTVGFFSSPEPCESLFGGFLDATSEKTPTDLIANLQGVNNFC